MKPFCILLAGLLVSGMILVFDHYQRNNLATRLGIGGLRNRGNQKWGSPMELAPAARSSSSASRVTLQPACAPHSAIDRYNPGSKTAFVTFALPRIVGAMIDRLRRADPAKRTLRGLQKDRQTA